MSTDRAPRRRDAVAKAAVIERAAVDLVLERGYDAVTVDMICTRAGVSQRTFFNHFPTKDTAIIGHDMPTIDERAARSFIVSTGPLLLEATQLIRMDDAIGADPDFSSRRFRAVGSAPALIARQIERLSVIEREVKEIVELRLKTQYPDATDDVAEQAEIITHILAGVMRYLGQSAARRTEPATDALPDATRVRSSLEKALRKLG